MATTGTPIKAVDGTKLGWLNVAYGKGTEVSMTLSTKISDDKKEAETKGIKVSLLAKVWHALRDKNIQHIIVAVDDHNHTDYGEHAFPVKKGKEFLRWYVALGNYRIKRYETYVWNLTTKTLKVWITNSPQGR